LSPQIDTIVGWLIYNHFSITAFTSGKGHPNTYYTSWSVYCFDPIRLPRS